MAERQSSRGQTLTPGADARYSSRIIKAGALLSDTKTLLSQWDTSCSVQANLDRIRHENTFGKASRSRVADILAIFRQRYLLDHEVTTALVALVKARTDANALDRILYFHATQSDQLLYDVVTEWLLPMQSQGLRDIVLETLESQLAIWVGEGKTTSPWSEATTRRVAQGLLSTLRDFGVLEGAVHKRIAPSYIPVTAFAYVLFYLKLHEPSGAQARRAPRLASLFPRP